MTKSSLLTQQCGQKLKPLRWMKLKSWISLIPITLPAVNADIQTLQMVRITMSDILSYSLLATIIYNLQNKKHSTFPFPHKTEPFTSSGAIVQTNIYGTKLMKWTPLLRCHVDDCIANHQTMAQNIVSPLHKTQWNLQYEPVSGMRCIRIK